MRSGTGLFLEHGFYHQYMRNVLEMNQGVVPGLSASGEVQPHFSDVAWITGTARTDWSWATLFMDLDNDGWKDLLVANGYLRDAKDRDFIKRTNEFLQAHQGKTTLDDINKMCRSVKLPNKIFRNLGSGLRFEDVSAVWGLKGKAFSYGAAYADLDRDGDLDLVISEHHLHIGPGSRLRLLRNRAIQQHKGNWLRIHLRGAPKEHVRGRGQGDGDRGDAGTGADHAVDARLIRAPSNLCSTLGWAPRRDH
jgi:hypothetical protein